MSLFARASHRARRGTRACRGLTIVELSVSTAILSVLVLAASTASQTALTATADVVANDAEEGTARHALDRLELLLVSASRSTLEGVPVGQGVTPEPLQEGVDYRDLRSAASSDSPAERRRSSRR